jgi:hypothetical protein
MAKKQISNYKFFPGVVPPAYDQFPDTVSLLEANKDYIIAEATEYLRWATSTPSYPAEYAASAQYAEALLTSNKEFIKEEANAWVLNQIATSTAPFVGYSYTTTKQTKCKRDIGYLIDAFIADLAGGGNAETIRIGRMFYLNGTAQLLNPTQEAAVHTFVKNLIISNVLPKAAYTTQQSPVVAAQVTTGTIAETFAITKVGVLNDIVISIITNGLSSVPAISYNYNQQFAELVYGATKCKRDIGYILDAVGFDIALSTNYNAIFVGLAESNSLDFNSTVISVINASKTQVLALSNVSASGTAVTRVGTDYTEILNIAANGATVASAVSFTNPSTATTSLIAVKDKLVANKAFIQAEINAWVGATYPAHNHNEAKCARDVGFAIDGFCYDMLYGGNSATYDQAKFFYYSGASGITEAHKAQTVAAYGRLKTIIGEIVQGNAITKTTNGTTPNTLSQTTSGNNANSTDATTLQALAQVVADVVNTGASALPVSRTVPSVIFADAGLQAAKLAIDSNKTTIQNAVVTYSDYTYNEAKCIRDTTYVVDSYIYDLAYGGNSLTYYVASRYYIAGVVQVNQPTVEVAIQTFVRDLVNSYVFINKYHPSYQLDTYQTVLSNAAELIGVTQFTTLTSYVINTISTGITALPAAVAPDSQNGNLLPNAILLLESNKRFIQEEAIAYIQYNIDNNIPPYVYYTYNPEKCRRDVSYVLEGYISDISHGGNRQTVFNAGKYWEGGVAQVDGDRQPEIYAHTFIRDLIENYIWNNLAYTPKQILAKQVIDLAITPETYANTRIKELSNTVLDVIANGTSYLPAVVSNRGYIKLPGYYKLKDFLLVTNATRNTIMFNFSDTDTAAEVTYTESFDSDFPGALYGVDKVTTLTFDVDTSYMMITDNIQVFVEGKEQAVRLNPIATDAMERMKVGIPQSMLDADFEYGLQPTKWQALALMRNYPSLYEIPGSDIAVTNVVTDASTGNTPSGAGASLITVTTQNAHGFSVGDPFTIKALANTITGFSRAEGSFLISSVPSLVTFTFWAKSKVGSSNGQILASTYTQLRKGGFYTGASIGNPSFSVYASGSNGTITTALTTLQGKDVIGFSGNPPPLGSPLSGTGITSGTQITAVTGGGGVTATTTLSTNAAIGATTLVVTDTTGISPGLLFDRGDGAGSLVTDVSGNIVSIQTALTSAITGTNQTYTAVTQTSTTGNGSGAIFTISRNASGYSVSLSNPGQSYVATDTITIDGTNLSGVTSTNDATITVVSATPVKTVSAINYSAPLGNGYSSGIAVATTVTPSGGTGLTVDITASGSISVITVNAVGTGYAINDQVTITGGNGDATFTVTGVDAGGIIQSISIAGTAITTPSKNFYSAFTMSDVTTAQIASGNTGISYTAIATIQVSFTTAHGFVPGDTITVQITSTDTGAQLAAGPYFVEQVPSPTILRYTARAAGTINNTLVGIVYSRPDSYFVHRPFDGGVLLGTASPSHGASAIRMSKKYIRYQSGKGVAYNTGALFAPSYDIRSMTATGTAVGSVITVVTDDVDHGCQVGGGITIEGSLTSGYDGQYTVTDISNERQFSVLANQTLGATTAILGTPCQMSVRNWHGSTIRAGVFDDQNGMFWQYDGIRMGVCRRSSTFQIAGTIAVLANSNLVTGTNTRFTTQLAAGDRIVVRGMSHVVSQITSDTSLTFTPDYRGVNNLTEAKCAKTIDSLVPQDYWNLDTLNGAGASGYTIDVTKMQMIGLQHTWYGAGFIDFMLRGPDGNYTFAHRFRNSNVNSEAYMRTGNQPVRYEVINEGARGKLVSAMNAIQTTILLSSTDAYWFPSSGTVMIDSELIRYTGNTGTTLTGCTRAAALTQFTAGAQRNFTGSTASTHTVNTGVILVSNTITPNISHWGSAFMIDGQFDSDRGYIFNYAATGISTSIDKATAFLIRLAPSVSNAQVGDLGDKELLNRAQLLLSGISVTSDSGTGAIVVEGILNPINYPTDPTKITWTGLSNSAAGGQPSFAQIASGGSVTWSGGSSTATSTVNGAFTTTLTAKSFAPVTQTLTAKSFSAVTQNLIATSFAPTVTTTLLAKSFTTVTQNITAWSFSAGSSTTYRRALQNNRTDFLMLDSDFDALTTPLAVGDVLSALTYLTGSQTIASITRNYINIGGFTTYTRIVMSGFANVSSNTASFDGSDNITITVTNAVTSTHNNAISLTRNDFIVTDAAWATAVTAGILSNEELSATTFLVGTQAISSVTTSYANINGVFYTRVVMNAVGSANSTSGTGNDVTVSVLTATSLTLYSRAISTARSDFLITTAAYDALTTPLATTDGLSNVTYATGGKTVQSFTRNYITLNTVSYTRVVMSGVGNALSPRGTGNNITITATSSVAATYAAAVSASRQDFLITQTQYATLTLVVQDVLSATTFITGGQSITSATPSYTTIAGVVYARVLMTANGTATSTAGTGNDVTVTSTSYSTATYGRALSTTRTDFLITDTQYASSGIATSDILSVITFITGSQIISSITPSYINIGGTLYTRILMNAVANSNSTSGGGNDITVTVTAAGTASTYATKNYLFFDATTWITSTATVGTKLATSVTQFTAGTSVAATATRQFGTVASVVTAAASSGGGSTVTYTLTGTQLYAVGSKVDVTGITGGTGMNGTFVVTSSVAGTLIVTSTGSGTPSSYVGASLTGTTVYRVTFTQTSNTTISAAATITFQFGAQYALPGEQVFSFITNPGASETLSLESLKELTATAIGGRGTFPNGPDVLAINIYKISGSAVPASLILRWGEAQA